jgi:serine/threonine protein kinase
MVARRYRVVDVIGKGGMSTVYKVLDLELNDTVALKLFTQPSNDEAVERLIQGRHDRLLGIVDLGIRRPDDAGSRDHISKGDAAFKPKFFLQRAGLFDKVQGAILIKKTLSRSL